MRLSVTDREIWEPDWLDNLELPSDERLKVHIKYPTTKSQGHMQRIVPKVSSSGGRDSVEVEVAYDNDRVLTACVPKLENLTVEFPDGKERTITTGADLLEAPGLGDLRDMIVAKIMSKRVEAETRKNS